MRVVKRYVAAAAPKKTTTKKPKTLQEVADDFEAKLAARKAVVPAVKQAAPMVKQADFPENVVRQRFKEVDGRCECDRKTCKVKHKGRCPERFEWNERDTADNPDAWQGHHWRAQAEGGSDDLRNCEILCVPCHMSTPSYGRPADK